MGSLSDTVLLNLLVNTPLTLNDPTARLRDMRDWFPSLSVLILVQVPPLSIESMKSVRPSAVTSSLLAISDVNVTLIGAAAEALLEMILPNSGVPLLMPTTRESDWSCLAYS